jgi:hypothetical protein
MKQLLRFTYHVNERGLFLPHGETTSVAAVVDELTGPSSMETQSDSAWPAILVLVFPGLS